MVLGNNNNAEGGARNLPSVFEVVPDDFGGIRARQGFAFQDDVAAGFYVRMLSESDLSEVSCETYDDILLLHQQVDGVRGLEFVQVKGEHLDGLWSVARLCRRQKSPNSPNGIAPSVLERSLLRDKYAEIAQFRIVTCRQVSKVLEVLTRERGHEHRSASYEPFKALLAEVADNLGDVRSGKGNGVEYWLTNTVWEVVQEANVRDLNRLLLGNVLHGLGLPHDPDMVRLIYDNLRALAKETAEYGPEKWSQKRVSRTQLVSKVRHWINPYPRAGKIRRLQQKLTKAGLDQVCVNVAKDQRSSYLRKRRSGEYLNVKESEDTEQRVLQTLHNLRSSLDSGSIEMDGVGFHDRCLREVQLLQAPNAEGAMALPPGFLEGCMYEITARCRHRFTRVEP